MAKDEVRLADQFVKDTGSESPCCKRISIKDWKLLRLLVVSGTIDYRNLMQLLATGENRNPDIQP